MRSAVGVVAVVLVGTAACNDDVASLPEQRCALLEDRVTLTQALSTSYPWPVNTSGDERQEMWFPSFDGPTGVEAMVGFEPLADGTYVERWGFERPGMLRDFRIDFDGNGYADLIMQPEDGVWQYYPTGSDGLPAEMPTLLDVGESEEPLRWLDLDGDGPADRISWIDDDLWYVSTAAQTSTPLGFQVGEAKPSVQIIRGDRNVLLIRTGEWQEAVLTLGRLEADGTFERIWGSSPGEFFGGNAAVSPFSGIELYARDPASSNEPRPYDLYLLQIDDAGEVVETTLIERKTTAASVEDYDGDGYLDVLTHGSSYHLHFRLEDGSFTRQGIPKDARWDDDGPHQTFDLDDDGAMDTLLRFYDDGTARWQSLEFERCADE